MNRKMTLAVLLFVFTMVFAQTVFAENAAFKLSDGSAKAGETVVVDVSIVNNPGLASFTFDLLYDENILECVAIEQGDLDGIWDTAIGRSITWVSADNYTESKTVLSVIFKIKEETMPGKTEVSLSYDADDVFNENEENVFLSVIPGHIEVKADESILENDVDKYFSGEDETNAIQNTDAIAAIDWDSMDDADNVDNVQGSLASVEHINNGSMVGLTSGHNDGFMLDPTSEHTIESYMADENIVVPSDSEGNVADEDLHGPNEHVAISRQNEHDTISKQNLHDKDGESSDAALSKNQRYRELKPFMLVGGIMLIIAMGTIGFLKIEKDGEE